MVRLFCVCVCECVLWLEINIFTMGNTHTHTHRDAQYGGQRRNTKETWMSLGFRLGDWVSVWDTSISCRPDELANFMFYFTWLSDWVTESVTECNCFDWRWHGYALLCYSFLVAFATCHLPLASFPIPILPLVVVASLVAFFCCCFCFCLSVKSAWLLLLFLLLIMRLLQGNKPLLPGGGAQWCVVGLG